MGSNVGFRARSKSKTNYRHSFKTQAHIHVGNGVVMAKCGVHIAPVSHRKQVDSNKSTQTNPILVPVRSLEDKENKSLALKRLAFSKKFSIERQTVFSPP